MTDKPILFSPPMVRSILREIEKPGSGKTQTRRALECGDLDRPFQMDDGSWHVADSQGGHMSPLRVRYSVGDRLWVREPWRTLHKFDSLAPRNLPDDRSKITYEADPEHRNPLWAFGKLRPSMFMPRWASRLTLTVTAVKVERLQDISEADAIAEGVPTDDDYAGSFEAQYCRRCGGEGTHGAFGSGYGVTEVDCLECETPKLRFRNLWNSINGPDAWAANPWVVAYTFTPALGNIDQAKRSAA